MIDKETYRKEIVRMWDSIRDDEYKGTETCAGVNSCDECPLEGKCIITAWNVFKMIEFVEQWSKEHQPKKLTRLEYDILKWLDKGDYKFIVRNPGGNLMIYYDTPEKDVSFWFYDSGCKILSGFNELFKFIQWEDKEPTSIQDILKNCEVKEDV